MMGGDLWARSFEAIQPRQVLILQIALSESIRRAAWTLDSLARAAWYGCALILG